MKPIVVGIGELLWDLLPAGPRMGGAPANFTCHAGGMGAEASVISRVGADAAGDDLVASVRALGVGVEAVSRDPAHPTGTVRVELGADGQPEFTITPGAAWDHWEESPSQRALARRADALCFGTLGQRSISSRKTIRSLVTAAPAGALKIFDMNLRGGFYTSEILHDSLEIANVCKLSDAELPVAAAMLGLRGDARECLDELSARYGLRLIAYTRGGNGSLLGSAGAWHEHPGYPAEVKDTIGAGDSFTSAVAMGLLADWELEKISDAANRVASFVCSQEGAVPVLPPALRNLYEWSGWRNKALPEPVVPGVSQKVSPLP